MKVYSPSQTERAMSCPMKNALYNEGWRTRKTGPGLLPMEVGKAIAAGLGVYNNIRKGIESSGRQIDTIDAKLKADYAKTAMDVGFTFLTRGMDEIEKLGYILGNGAEEYIRTIKDRIGKSLTSYINNDPLSPKWRIVDVERTYGPEYGNARPDLVIEDDFGLAVVDYKTKSALTPKYRTEDSYTESHQMKHYCCFGEAIYNRPVQRFYICQIITNAGSVNLKSYEYSTEALLLWRQATEPFWQYMEQVEKGEALPWMASNHETKYGPCEFQRACFSHRFDQDLMKSDYILVEKDTNGEVLAKA